MVKVRALEWVNNGLVATKPHSAWYFVNETGRGWRYHYGESAPFFKTPEEAKEAAQENYNSLILSALEEE